MFRRFVCLTCVMLVLGACRRETPSAPPGAPAANATVAATRPVATGLQDVVEQDPRYVIGISYPPIAGRYPGLAAALKRYADAARAELMQAVNGLGGAKPSAPYELSLSFTELVATPDIVAVAADGSSYTGGAHSAPLIARFVWLPGRQQMLTADALIPGDAGWRQVSDFVREQLHTALSQRLEADEIAPADQVELRKSAGRVIDEGTTPDAQSFAQFEPVLDRNGRITALRFVFPPYQVGSYADGTQTVDVPASLLLPIVAPAYRDLFATG